MDKPNVHQVLKTGKCVTCHDAHGSNAPHMLKAGGADACFECHAEGPVPAKTVHAVVARRTAAAPATWPTPRPRRTCSAPTRSPSAPAATPPTRRASRRPTAATRRRPAAPATIRTPPTARSCSRRRSTAPVSGGGCDSCHAPRHEPEALRRPGDGRGALRQLPRRRLARRRWQGPARTGEGGRLHRLPRPARLGQCPPHPRPGKRALPRAATPQMGQKFTAPHKVVATGKGCLACHAPHQAKVKKLLRAEGSAQCATCHAKSVKAASREEGAARRLPGRRLHGLPRPARLQLAGDDGRASGPGLLRLPRRSPGEVREDLHPQAGAGGELQRLPRRARLGQRQAPQGGGSAPLPQVPRRAHEGAGHGRRTTSPTWTASASTATTRTAPTSAGLLHADQKSTCLKCHANQAKEAQGAKAVHASFDRGECTKCHSAAQGGASQAHAGQDPRPLLRLPQGDGNAGRGGEGAFARSRTASPATGRTPGRRRSSSSMLPLKLCEQCHDTKAADFQKGHLAHRPGQDDVHELPHAAHVEERQALPEERAPAVRRAAVRRLPRRREGLGGAR